MNTADPNIPSRRIADMSEDEKPREKALQQGIRTLSDAELLALLIANGTRGKSAIDLAKEILDSCGGSIDQLSQMSIKAISSRFRGIGIAKATTIAAAVELGSRRKSGRDARKMIKTSTDAYDYIRCKLENLPVEEFWVIFLRRNNSIIMAERISSGGASATYVEPRQIVKKALDNMASSIILAHNHPSGNLHPSVQDDKLTARIKDAARLLDIPVLDHLIVTPSSYYSYKDESRL